MNSIKITEYTTNDNEEALALENTCVQGKSLVLKYRRPTFHARSGVYEKYRILCARMDGCLAGIAAWAEKEVMSRNKRIKSAYLYDLRVHPDFRSKGVSIHLAHALFDDIGSNMDCIYTWIAGQNERCIKPAQRLFAMKRMEPFTYVVFPVFKKRHADADWCFTAAEETHQRALQHHGNLQFVPDFNEESLLGLISSIKLQSGSGACSIWSNENLLAEQVVSVPKYYRLLRALSQPLKPWIHLPYIPKQEETLQSWFLFDLIADRVTDFKKLISIVNDAALEKKRQFLYLLLQNNSPLLEMIQKLGFWTFTFPYCYLAKGPMTPGPDEEIYVDIRDL